MKKCLKLYTLFFLLFIPVFVFFNSTFFDFSPRYLPLRIMRVPYLDTLNEPHILDIEKSVAQQDGWEEISPGVSKTTIEYLAMQQEIPIKVQLLKPISIAKKNTDNKVFLTHLICNLLEKFFRNRGDYTHRHISDVLNFFDEGYYYIWVPGSENISLSYQGIATRFREMDKVTASFKDAGIRISHDLEDAQFDFHNVIIAPEFNWYKDHVMPILDRWEQQDGDLLERRTDLIWIPADQWTRIDLDPKSMPVDQKKLNDFLKRNDQELKKYLSEPEYELLMLINKCRNGEINLTEKMGTLKKLFTQELQQTLEKNGYISNDQNYSFIIP